MIVGYYGEIYRFLLNKWYFDELYDWLFVRPAMKLGRVLWKGGDGAIIDGFGPDGIAALTRLLPAGRAVAERIRLPLRFRDDDRRGRHRILVLADARGLSIWSDWPLLSL